MLMTRIDSHIAKGYLARYVLTLIAILGVYVIVDAIDRLPSITRQDTVRGILRAGGSYYLSHAPLFLFDFASAINLIAGVITLGDMLSRNEFTIMRTAGISGQRALLALVAVALIPGLVIWQAQERLGPSLLPHYRFARKAVRRKDDFRSARDLIVSDSSDRTFVVDTYLPAEKTLRGVSILPRPGDSTNVYAPRGEFAPGGVKLHNAIVWEVDSDIQRRREIPEMFLETNLSHEVLVRQRIVLQFLEEAQLRELAKALRGWPAEERSVTIERHRRYSDLFEGFGLLLLSIPIVVWWSTRVQGLSMAWWLVKLVERLLPVLVFATFYGLKLALAVGLSPWLAAWVPVGCLCVAGISAYCLARL